MKCADDQHLWTPLKENFLKKHPTNTFARICVHVIHLSKLFNISPGTRLVVSARSSILCWKAALSAKKKKEKKVAFKRWIWVGTVILSKSKKISSFSIAIPHCRAQESLLNPLCEIKSETMQTLKEFYRADLCRVSYPIYIRGRSQPVAKKKD